MTIQRGLVAAAVLVAGLLLSGCDSTATGTPVPESGTSRTEPPSTGESERLAPPIDNPKDLRGIEPCQLLTPEQVTELSFTEPGVPESAVSGDSACRWSNSNLDIYLQVNTDGGGLDQAYKGSFDNFEETSVGDYPAVRVNFATQFCTVIVGVADDQVLFADFGRVTGDDPAYDDPCGFAETVAGMVLENLPAG